MARQRGVRTPQGLPAKAGFPLPRPDQSRADVASKSPVFLVAFSATASFDFAQDKEAVPFQVRRIARF